jgi:hypothetical protein
LSSWRHKYSHILQRYRNEKIQYSAANEACECDLLNSRTIGQNRINNNNLNNNNDNTPNNNNNKEKKYLLMANRNSNGVLVANMLLPWSKQKVRNICNIATNSYDFRISNEH